MTTIRNSSAPGGVDVRSHGGFDVALSRLVGLVAVALATAIALVAATLLVLVLLSAGPTGIAGDPGVVAGGFVLVSAPTVVWQVGAGLVDASVVPER